ncbi:unnamed protein product [Tilletia caries]|nr:unnamed protein product [Tilletia caries]CAD7066225.1 unnamed protein product [Tilletia caries]
MSSSVGPGPDAQRVAEELQPAVEPGAGAAEDPVVDERLVVNELPDSDLEEAMIGPEDTPVWADASAASERAAILNAVWLTDRPMGVSLSAGLCGSLGPEEVDSTSRRRTKQGVRLVRRLEEGWVVWG